MKPPSYSRTAAASTSQGRHFLWTLAVSGLLLMSCLEVAFAGRNIAGLLFATLLGVPAAWFLVRIGKSMVKQRDSMDLFSPLLAFPLLYVFWFGFASAVLSDDPDPLPYGYFVIGLLCYLGGAILGRSWACAQPAPAVAAVEDEWVPRLFWKAVAGLAALSGISYIYLVWQMGIPVLSSEAGELRGELGSYGISKAIFLSAAWTIFVLIALQLSRQRTNQKRRLFSVLLLVLTGAALLSFGNRGFLIVPALTAIAARQYIGKMLKVRILAVIAISAFVAASLYGYVRDTLLTQGYVALQPDGDAYTVLLPFMYAGVYMQYSVATFRDVTQVIPDRVPYQHGALSLGALTQILPGHHETSDMFFKRILGNDFIGGGQPATVLGPLYGDFGAVGIAVGMFLFGVLCSAVYSWMLRRPTICRAAIYGWVLQTALTGIIGFFFTYIATLWIPLMWLCLDVFIRRGGLLDVDLRKRWCSVSPSG